VRILLVSNLVHVPAHGGASKANRRLLEALAARGHTCRAVALATGETGPGARAAFLDELTRRGIRATVAAPGVDRFEVGGVAVQAAADPGRLLALAAREIESFAPTAVLLSHAGPAEPLLEAVLEASPRRLAYLAHTPLWLPFGPAAYRQNPRAAALLARASGILTVSRFMRDYLARWGGLPSTVLHFPLYGPGPFARLGRFDQGAITLVNPSSVKGISIFLRLAALFPHLPFAAVPTYRTTRGDRAALCALPNVRLLPAVDDVERLFAQVRVLLMPSLWDEAFGLTAVEAMLHGIPVLASDLGGLPEAKLGVDYVLPVRRIERYEERLDDRREPLAVVPEQDVSPWAVALREVAEDRARYDRLSAESREAALAFVARIGWEPFEAFCRDLPEIKPSGPAEEGGGGAGRDARRDGDTAALLTGFSAARRELVALLLAEQRRRAAGGAPEPSPPSPLVAIEPRGALSPLFLVHPAAGTVDGYVPLARHLGPDQPLYAFQAAGLDGRREPCCRVGEMAAGYLAALRGRQPRGPYFLGGWSLGAIVAFEMARELRRAGEEIRLLALLDSRAPLAEARGADAVGRGISDSALIDLWARELADDPGAAPPEDPARFVLARLQELRLLPASAGLPELARGLAVYRAHRQAVHDYEPEVYPGKITLFRAAEDAPGEPDPALGWSLWSTEPVEVLLVPGSHRTILLEPHVAAFARALGNCLTRARSRPPGGGS
jgi:thioesterase domain-containing protein/glycosyltransferase involved in cell wall biosynthesis